MVRNPKRKSNPEVSDDDLELQQPSTSKVQRRNDVAGPSVPTTNNTSMNGHAENEFDHLSDDEEGGIRIGDIYIPPAPEPTLSMDSKAPRLLIKKIVNEDFKSYKGKVELGPFQKSFTSIIGPNGSGKSNVIDSMLFVFGYRASKIRSKKISSLIHNSEKYPNVKSATVAVHFVQIVDKEGEYDYDELPGTEIVVTRTAHIDNSSYYTLNGRRVQFKAVAKLLKSHGIDLIHNRFLILQGEVEQIAMMKFKGANENETGLLEYLDDIISTVRYKEPLVKIAERTDELTDLRREKLNRVRFVEAEKLQLERPMKDAVDQLNARNNATRARSALLQKYIHEVEKMIKEKTSEYDNLKEEQKKQDGMIKETQAKIEEKQKFLKEQNKKYDKLNNRKEELMTKNKTLKNRDGTITAETNQCNKRKKNVEALLKTENGKLMDLKKIPEKNTREIAECEELDQQLVQKKAALEEKMNTLIEAISSETRGLQEEIHKLKTRLIGLNEIESKAQMKLKLAESELEILLRNETEERNKFEKLTESLSKATKDLTEKKARLTQINTSLPAAEKELTATERQLTALGQELTATNGEVRTLRATLQERRDSVSAANSRNKVLNFIMEQKRIGALPGVYGRMGDLGGIDTKYDVAISTCCGALDNILVDTVDTGVKCIELLKQHNIGKCTFIALEKQEHLRRQAEQRITTPENVPRLFDLIKVTDKRVLPAFYFALRDTLVAHDLEQATRIAYGRVRYRVVSLNGDVIEVAGTMSGGGRSVIRGRMGASVKQNTSQATDPRVLAEQEKKLNDMQDRIKELRETILNLEKKKEDFKKKRDEMRNEKSKLEAEVKHLIEQVPALKNQLKDQESKIKNSTVDPKQKAKLQKAIEIATREHDEAKKNLQELTDQVNEVQGQIKAIAGDRLKKLTKEIAEVTSKIEKVRTEVTKLKVAINASGRNIRNSQQKIGHMETDIKEIDAKLKNLQDETKVNAVEAKKIEKELDEIEESLSEGDTHTELKEELAKLQKRETKLKSLKIDMDNDLDKLKKAISDHKLKMPAWSKELSSLQLEDPNIANFPKPDALETIPAEELEGLNVEELRNKCKVLRDRISDGLLNIGAIKEYYLKEALFLKRAEELEEITGRRNEMRELLAGLRKKRQDEFLASFSRISARVREMYQMITIGGDAELELVDSFDPYSEGVRFNVRPPLKTWKAISNLSGGEKTLSSLALVFALHYYKPSPLYVMDEIDAALDFKNVSIVANYIRERTKNAQFIIISLRYNMFENANRLVGIYKVSDCTGSITIENTPPPPPSSSLERLEKEVEDQTNAASERTVAPLQMQNCNGAISAPNEPEVPIELDGVDDEAMP